MASAHYSAAIAISAAALLTAVLIRLTMVLPQYRRRGRRGHAVSTMVFFGSGGHTSEMLALLMNLVGRRRYQPLHMVLGHSDSTSYSQIQGSGVMDGVSGTNAAIQWHSIWRSREVRQSWITTLFTALVSSVQAFALVLSIRPDLLICNGPGTCVPLCYAAFLLRLVGVKEVDIVFVESFCRVKDLSLSGKLVYAIAG